MELDGRGVELDVKCGTEDVGVEEDPGLVDGVGGQSVSGLVKPPSDAEPFSSFASEGKSGEGAFDDEGVSRVAESAGAVAETNDWEVVAGNSDG